jgi:gliding motility-associated-like protein
MISTNRYCVAWGKILNELIKAMFNGFQCAHFEGFSTHFWAEILRGYKLKMGVLSILVFLCFPDLYAHKSLEKKGNTLEKEPKERVAGFTFDCNNPIITGSFYASGVSQLGFITLRINNVTSGPTSVLVNNLNGFTGGLSSIPLTATQTSIQIPITFNGRSPAGFYTLVISSPDATNICNVTVVVDACTAYKPTISTNVPSILCVGDSVRMTASAGSQYAWNTGETSPNILKRAAGNYMVTVTYNGCTGVASQAITLNNNCEAGFCTGVLANNSYNITFGRGGRTDLPTAVAGATTTHVYSPTGVIVDGQYAVGNNATDAGAWAINVGDHSGDGPTGRLMVINADNTPKECFRLPVKSLCSNLKYQFSAWIRSISNRPEKPNVTLEIRDAVTDSLLAIKGTGDILFGSWIQYGLTFTTPNNPNLIMVLRNNTKGGTNGNDIVIDDIQFAYCGPPVVLTMQGGSFDAPTGEGSSCVGKTMFLKSSITPGYVNSPVFQWQESLDNGINWRDIVGATSVNHSFVSDSVYGGRKFKLLVAEVGKISNPSCRVESNVLTFKLPSNTGIINVIGATSFCAGDSVILTATNGSLTSPTYLWNTGEITETVIKKTSGVYTVSITDVGGCTSTASKTITVNPKPIASLNVIGEVNLKFGGSATLTASGGSSYTWSTGDKVPSISISTSGVYSVTITTAAGCSVVVTKAIGVNTPPYVSVSNPSVKEDSVLIGEVVNSVIDLDNNINPNSFAVVDKPLNGTIVMTADGSYTYTPRADFNGIDSVHYQVCDLAGACTRGTIIIKVISVNDAPKVNITTPLVTEDTPVNFCGTINDRDIDDAFNTRLCNLPQGAVNAVINKTQLCISYVPQKDFSGKDTVCLLVCDKEGLCDTVILPISVVAVNDPPVLVTNKIIAPSDSTIGQCYLIVDPDLHDDHLVTLCNVPKGNTQVKIENGKMCVTYSTRYPTFDKDTICVTLCDKAGACVTANIPVIITPCEDKASPIINCPEPIEISTVGTVLSDPSGFIRASTLADNCGGVNLEFKMPTATDDCSLPTVLQTSGLRNGGTFPKGLNILIFESTDKSGKKANCRLEIRVSPTQLIVVDNVSACINETLNIQAKVMNLATYAWKTPQNFSSSNPSIDVPITNANQAGLYIVSLTMGKNCVFKDTVIVNINASPKIVNDSFFLEMDSVFTGNVLKNDMVSNGTVLTLKTRDNSVNGSVDIKSDGAITYRPSAGFKGVDNFTYEVCTDLCPSNCPKGTVIMTVRDAVSQIYKANEVITPNGDNFNEALIIEDFDVNDPKNKSTIAIYSQWGELVFSASPYMNNWKGTHKNLSLPEGTYYYVFKADSKSAPLKSFITISR